jgi:hypothetical protein
MNRELPDLLPVDGRHRPLWLRLLCLAGALVCLALGVVGWLVPVVTGIPFYAAAAVLLAIASDRARLSINALERRFPYRVRVLLRNWLGRSRHLRRLMRLGEDPADG